MWNALWCVSDLVIKWKWQEFSNNLVLIYFTHQQIFGYFALERFRFFFKLFLQWWKLIRVNAFFAWNHWNVDNGLHKLWVWIWHRELLSATIELLDKNITFRKFDYLANVHVLIRTCFQKQKNAYFHRWKY